MIQGQSSFPNYEVLRSGSRQGREKETSTKPQQGKARATKSQQDLPDKIANYSRLLLCKAYGLAL
jgi:hypothetical protein